MLRWTARSLPPTGLSTLGFDPARYQTEPPSLLPGSLATTRTGLTPAGGDELIFGSGHPSTTSESLGTRRSSRKRRQRSGLGCCRDLRYRGAPLTLHRMGVPVTRYARVGGVNIAYQGIGEGPLDLVWLPSMTHHVELAWESPAHVRLLNRFASFSRLIVFDKRGTGMSDRLGGADTLETRMVTGKG
jgi:hypothetical protein